METSASSRVSGAATLLSGRLAADQALSSPDLVVAAIKRGILIGRFVPGQRLIEADLTRDLKVSRGPVREALKRLAAEGVVALTPHRGAYIRLLTRGEVIDLLQVLKIIIGLAVRLAATRIKRELLEGRHDSRRKLSEAYQRLEQQGPHGDRVLQSIERTAFYDAIFEIAGNRELIRINPVVPTQILRMQSSSFMTPEERERQFSDYRLLFDAIAAGDPNSAKRVVDLHVRRSRMQIQHLPDDAFAAEAGAR